MSKEIIINASKDRSRIAIVEDGELVELYVENPDNVRTIGNIYLGRIRKIMPAIRATFVDIGQQQDAFLHFSDLTDNVPELLAIAAGDIPDARSLMKAPKSLTANDDDDTATADLEMESEDERRSRHRREQTKRRRGRRGGRRRGGRNRNNNSGERSGNGRSEEEEEESTPRVRRTSPYVIDLTSQPAKQERSSAEKKAKAEKRTPTGKKATASDSQADASAQSDSRAETTASESNGDVKDKRSSRSRSRRSKQSEAPQEEAPQSEAPDVKAETTTEDNTSEGTAPTKASSRSRGNSSRSSSGRSSGPRRRSQRRSQRTEDASESDAKAQADEATASKADSDTSTQKASASGGADEEPTSRQGSRRRGGRRRSPQRSDSPQHEASQDDEGSSKALADDQPSENEARTEAKSDPSERRRGGRRSSRSRSKSQNDAQGAADDSADTPAEPPKSADARSESASDDTNSGGRSRSRGRRGGRGRSGDSRSGDSRSKDNSGKDSNRSSESDKKTSPRSQRSPRTSSGSKSGGTSETRPIAMVASSKRAEDYLKRDQNIIVKIIKEPISSKGSRISTDISLAGRFLVLVPMADYVAVSKKIESSKERRRLRSLASSLRPEGFGVIVRTVADGRDAKALDTDLSLLLDKWRSIEKQLRDKVKPPAPLYEDVNMVSSIIRDLFTEDFDRILIDDPKLYRNVKGYVEAVAPQMAKNVQLYKGRQGIFRSAGIERSVEEAFSPRVNMKSGGYLFIEHTEAMHVVDVNSGRAGRGKSQSQNLLDVNLEAAKEIAKQLRLRDLGGIICVDFIDMRLDSHRKKLYDTLKQEFRKDRAVTKLLPMSDFGVVQITRQRLRPSITAEGDGENGQEAAGASEIVQNDRTRREIERIARDENATVVTEVNVATPAASPAPAAAVPTETPSRTAAEVVSHLEAWLRLYRDNVGEKHKHRPIVVRVHPFTAAFLKRGIPSTLLRWRMRMRQPRFEVDVTDDVNPLAFEVCDKKSGKDLTKKYSVESGK